MHSTYKTRLIATVGVLVAGIMMTGCGKKTAAGPQQSRPPEVGVVVVHPERVALTTELSGRTSAFLVAEVRPQVNGIIQKRVFTEGSDVKAGQVLYQIDPATYQAAYASAKAAEARADANLIPARLKQERYRDLVKIKAVSQQDYDNAYAALKQAEADVASAKAALESARINLAYTKVTAPISGRIGRSAVTTGALVTANQPAPLATIQQLSSMYVDVTQSSADLLKLKQNLASGMLKNNGAAQAKVKLLLEDGTAYPLPGTLKFSEVTVEPSTGSITLRAIFPNPKQSLLPGMFVRAILEEGVSDQAILIPQRGVTRNPAGNAMVLVVGAEEKVEPRVIKVIRTVGDSWLVSEGLKAGDRVILEGIQKARPGTVVKAAPFGGKPAVPVAEAASKPAGKPCRARCRSSHPACISQKVKESLHASFFHQSPDLRLGYRHHGHAGRSAGDQEAAGFPVSAHRAAADRHQRSYPGASAQTVQDTVTQVIEQKLNGIDNLIYMASTSDSAGAVSITLTFKAGTDPNIAQVQVQNKLQLAVPLLPQIVQRSGIQVVKSTRNFLMIVGLVSEDGSMDRNALTDYMVSNLQDIVSRLEGVGELLLFGTQNAMRIWVNPVKLNNYHLTTDDVTTALQAQNVQVSAGQFGAVPANQGQQLNATINARTLLQTPEQFDAIVLRTNSDGSTVRLKDVAESKIGTENYEIQSYYNGKPLGGMAIRLAAGANALETGNRVKAKMAELSRYFPPGMKVVYPYDTTPFVKISIEEVVHTLIEAVFLVFIIMFLFLQNIRATLIPTIAVPVVLLGTMGVLASCGFSINTLTMFALVIVIGLLVDDAIVVVENVERIMTEEGLPPKEATIKSMGQITSALWGIATVLAAVFLPMAFFPGSTGVIYRQFSITIISAMILSVLVAMILTPALCATLLKPVVKGAPRRGIGVVRLVLPVFQPGVRLLPAQLRGDRRPLLREAGALPRSLRRHRGGHGLLFPPSPDLIPA